MTETIIKSTKKFTRAIEELFIHYEKKIRSEKIKAGLKKRKAKNK